MTEKTVSQCAYDQLGFGVASGPSRFRSPGWFAVGQTVSQCVSCNSGLFGYRKPYRTRNGSLFHYWALVCPKCQKAVEPSELSPVARKMLYDSSTMRPSDSAIAIPDVRKKLNEVQRVPVQSKYQFAPTDEIESPSDISLRPCSGCGERIPKERISKEPSTRYCFTCKSKLEGNFNQTISEGLAGTREEHKRMRSELSRDMWLRNRQ